MGSPQETATEDTGANVTVEKPVQLTDFGISLGRVA